MAIKVNTSFKETDDDAKLLTEVNSHSDKSAFIKEAIKFYIKYRHLQYQLEKMNIKIEH